MDGIKYSRTTKFHQLSRRNENILITDISNCCFWLRYIGLTGCCVSQGFPIYLLHFVDRQLLSKNHPKLCLFGRRLQNNSAVCLLLSLVDSNSTQPERGLYNIIIMPPNWLKTPVAEIAVLLLLNDRKQSPA